mgnify:CR=1 FL=1|uniref:FtsQ-type POTRA domain-containing protein n=1 Tax=Schlesneria paludicola TaxID=360056 RepID=A0A7C4QQT1_9PLAN
MANTKSGPSEPPPRAASDDAVFRPRSLCKFALLAFLAVIGPWIARQLPLLDRRPEYRLPVSQVRLEPEPTDGVPADLVWRVKQRSQLPDEVSLLDPELPKTLAAAFAEHPWIERVVQVRNQYPALVTVCVEYRRPVAVVIVKSGLYPVDGQGVLLPPQDFDPAAVERLIPIRGVITTPFGPEGTRWDDPAVIAAADLARYLGSRWRDLQLAAIHVARPASAKSAPEAIPLELETTSGSRILWGRKPNSDYPGELSEAQKLGRLEKYLAEFGGFDRPHGPYEIDIRHWEEITRRPLPFASHNSRRHDVPRR